MYKRRTTWGKQSEKPERVPPNSCQRVNAYCSVVAVEHDTLCGGPQCPLVTSAASAEVSQRGERDSESGRGKGWMPMNWTDERVELLKKLWADGLSASQIAGAAWRRHAQRRDRQGPPSEPLGAGEAGIERAAAAEGADRATPHRPSARGFTVGNTALKAHAHPAPRRLPQPVPVEDLVVPISMNISLMALNDQMCKWPIRRSGQRRLPLLRPPQLQRPALLRISLPRRLSAGQRPPPRARPAGILRRSALSPQASGRSAGGTGEVRRCEIRVAQLEPFGERAQTRPPRCRRRRRGRRRARPWRDRR